MQPRPNHPDLSQKLAELYDRRGEALLVQPDPASGAQPNQCHDNAAAFCEAHPGCVVVTGWVVMDTGGGCLFIPHSIVQEPGGAFRDVTPQSDAYLELQFMPDNSEPLRQAIEDRIGQFIYLNMPDTSLLNAMSAPATDAEDDHF